MNRADEFAAIELKGEESDPTEIVTKALAELQASVDERLKAVEAKAGEVETKSAEKLHGRLDKLEARLNRPGVTETPANADIERKAFEAFIRRGELMSDFAESFGKAEGIAFLSGDGVGQPKGLLNAAGIAEIGTGNTTGFKATDPADTIISMFHALPSVHAQNGVWLMNRNTLGLMRTWKDGTGRYLLADPVSAGMPTTLLGRPVVEMPDMADVGADATPILFGDLQGYRIVDRVGFTALRDPYSLASKGQTRIHVRKRVGGDITHPDRFIKLTVAA